MGLVISIRDENGMELSEIIADTTNLLVPLIASSQFADSPMLSSIDLYGDTIFNNLQVPHLIDEMNRASHFAQDLLLRTLVARLLQYASRVKAEPHTYLAFIGD